MPDILKIAANGTQRTNPPPVQSSLSANGGDVTGPGSLTHTVAPPLPVNVPPAPTVTRPATTPEPEPQADTDGGRFESFGADEIELPDLDTIPDIGGSNENYGDESPDVSDEITETAEKASGTDGGYHELGSAAQAEVEGWSALLFEIVDTYVPKVTSRFSSQNEEELRASKAQAELLKERLTRVLAKYNVHDMGKASPEVALIVAVVLVYIVPVILTLQRKKTQPEKVIDGE